MEVPPVVLRERLWCKLRSNPRLKSYVGGNGKLRPVDGVCIGIVGVKPIEMTVRKEWATGAAMNDESAEDVAQGDLGGVRIAQSGIINVLTTSRARPILQRRRVTKEVRLACLLYASMAIAMRE